MLIESCKLNDVDARACLADVLARIADHPAKQIAELLPWNWKGRQGRRRSSRLSTHPCGLSPDAYADLIVAWLQPQPARERPNTFTQTALGTCLRPLHGRGEPYISADDVLKHLFVER